MKKNNGLSRSIEEELSSYISEGGEAELRAEVIKTAKHHILDSLAAIVSGSRLRPGHLAKEYVKGQGGVGVGEAQVIASPMVTSAINAAFANGVMAHADETDDHHSKSAIHPGCAIIPAALSMSEREGVDGITFLKGVVTGYEIGCRMTQALGSSTSRSTNIIGGSFGAAAAAAAIARLKYDQVRYVLSYTAQQASGVPFWVRDEEHIEKAFIFGGMTARNGVMTASLIQSGFTGVRDPFSGEHNFFEAFSPHSRPELLSEGLGRHYEIASVNIKKFSVGGPIQAILEALLILMEKHKLTSENVQSITARLPSWGAKVVNNRSMPDINAQHILAVALQDGYLTFEAAHSYERMKDPAVLEVKKRITLIDDPELDPSKGLRQGITEVMTKDGAKFREHIIHVRGTADNPMTTEEVEKKSRELITPVLGEDRSRRLIDTIWNLERVKNMRELRPLLSA